MRTFELIIIAVMQPPVAADPTNSNWIETTAFRFKQVQAILKVLL